jgi:nucleotide-binding universal stress UspA family protein
MTTQPDAGPVRRYLVVANQTLGGRQLLDKIHEYTAAGPCRFHVLVPATPIQQYRWPPPLAVPPTAGGGVFAEPPPVPEAAGDTHARARAHARLREELARLRALGVDADGEVGDPEPLEAIREILTRERFDEIILATLPPGISRWLRMDLPHRVARSTNLPVTHVVSQAAQDRVS